MTTTDVQLARCPACGATNRVPSDAVAERKTIVCGRCKTPLTSTTESSHPLVVTDASFEDQVERSPVPVLVDFWADWCGPCHMLAPTVE